jgi:hypothetical protein
MTAPFTTLRRIAMIKVLLAGAALIAAPAFAQTAPAPTPPAPSATNGVPNTALSTSPTPSSGPRAQQGNTPANNDAATAGTSGGGEQPALPPQNMPAAPGQAPIAAPSEPVATALAPPPAPLDHYPVCKADQFTGCIEPGNRHRR